MATDGEEDRLRQDGHVALHHLRESDQGTRIHVAPVNPDKEQVIKVDAKADFREHGENVATEQLTNQPIDNISAEDIWHFNLCDSQNHSQRE